MSCKFLFLMGLLLLAASIFVFAAYAVSCDATTSDASYQGIGEKPCVLLV